MTDLATYLPTLILASASPARRALLEAEGIYVIVRPTKTNEMRESEQDQMVEELALRKLAVYLESDPVPSFPVLCCDTLISLDGHLIGKAKTRKEAFTQLRLFSGRKHEVASGWALHMGQTTLHCFDTATVSFKELSDEDINRSLDSGEWQGAAGSYRIQEGGKALVDSVEGDISTVVGLPLFQISAIISPDCVRV